MKLLRFVIPTIAAAVCLFIWIANRPKEAPSNPIPFASTPAIVKADHTWQSLSNRRKESIDTYFALYALDQGAGHPIAEDMKLVDKYAQKPSIQGFDTYAIANGSYLLVPINEPIKE